MSRQNYRRGLLQTEQAFMSSRERWNAKPYPAGLVAKLSGPVKRFTRDEIDRLNRELQRSCPSK